MIVTRVFVAYYSWIPDDKLHILPRCDFLKLRAVVKEWLCMGIDATSLFGRNGKYVGSDCAQSNAARTSL